MKFRLHVTIGVLGFLVGIFLGQCTAQRDCPDCRYERMYADVQSKVAMGVIESAADMLLAVPQDCLDTCRAQLKHCGCLRGQGKQDEIESQ